MKRIPLNKKIRDTVLIITNGKTEKTYFNSITQNFKSVYKLKVEYKNDECDEMVNYAVKEARDNDYNQVWVVFDIDESFSEGHLTAALHTARTNNIEIAYSNEAFEVWLLYHLKSTVSESLTRKTYSKELNKLLKEEDLTASYKKNDDDLLKNTFIPKLLTATTNAKKNYQRYQAERQREYITNKQFRIWEWKSTTTVYQLIEALRLTEKDN